MLCGSQTFFASLPPCFRHRILSSILGIFMQLVGLSIDEEEGFHRLRKGKGRSVLKSLLCTEQRKVSLLVASPLNLSHRHW